MAEAQPFDGTEMTVDVDRASYKGVNILGQKSRAWLLTINNPEKHGVAMDQDSITKAFKDLLDNGRITFLAAIMEQSLTVDAAGNHTPHGHIILYSPSQIRGSQIHKILPTASLQACAASVPSLVAYIKKDTAGRWYENHPEKLGEKLPADQAGFWEWGDIPSGKRQGSTAEKADKNAFIIEAVKAGLPDADILAMCPSTWLRPDSLRKTRYAIMCQRYRGVIRDMNVIYVEANLPPKKMGQLFPKTKDTYVVSDYTHAWDGYSAETTIVLFRFLGQFHWFDLCRYLDGIFCTLPARFTDAVACYNNVIIISPLGLEDLCDAAKNKGYFASTFMDYITHYRVYYSFDDLPEDYVRDKVTGKWRRQYLLPPHNEEREVNSHD